MESMAFHLDYNNSFVDVCVNIFCGDTQVLTVAYILVHLVLSAEAAIVEP